MKKKRIIGGLLATTMALVPAFSGCSLVSSNAAADMQQVIATVNIADVEGLSSQDQALVDKYKDAVGITYIQKMELIASRSRLGSDNNTAFLVGVASVERESFDDFDDAMSSDDSSSSTAPIDRPDFRSQEVTPLGGSQGGKLSRFFKSLFH